MAGDRGAAIGGREGTISVGRAGLAIVGGCGYASFREDSAVVSGEWATVMAGDNGIAVAKHNKEVLR